MTPLYDSRIGVRRIGTVPFTSASSHDSKAYDPMKTELSESQEEAENKPITMRVFRPSDRFQSDNSVFTGSYATAFRLIPYI